MTDAYEVAEDIYLIDTQLFSFPQYGSSYLLAEPEMALVEASCTTSADFVLDGIRKLGFDPKDMRYIIVTHIHLDHAGAAGVLLKEMPQAQVVVHQQGAKHLIDPSRLEKSMMKSLGEEMLKTYGRVTPIASERVLAVDDGDFIQLSKEQRLKVVYTPGHAPHHICIQESKNKGLFTGDAVGVFTPEEDLLIPTTPPPDINLEVWLNTLNKLKELPVEILYFSHFGIAKKVSEILERSIQVHQLWGDIVSAAMKCGGIEAATNELKAHAAGLLEPLHNKLLYDYVVNQFAPWCAMGLIKYYQEKQRS